MRIVLIFLFLSLKSFGQWVLIPCPTTVNLNSIHFGDNTVGYIGANQGGLLKTTNAGSTWSTINNFTTTSLHCIDKDTLFITSPNVIAVSNDGGLTVSSFTATYNGTNPQFFGYPSIHAVTSKYVWACARHILSPPQSGSNYSRIAGYVETSKNSGTNWFYTGAYGPAYSSIFFLDSITGYVVGYDMGGVPNALKYGMILKTNNSGATWFSLSLNGPLWESVYLVNKNIGYVAGNKGKLWKTADAGVTWTQQYTYTGTNFKSIHFSTPDTGCVVGANGFIMGTVDGGTTWTQQYSGTTNNLNSVYFTDKNNGYIVGDNGTILKTAFGPVGTKENKFAFQSEINVYPNPANDHFTIGNKNLKGTAELFDVSGRLLFEKVLEKNETTFSLEGMENGIYLLQIKSDEGTYTKKIIKE